MKLQNLLMDLGNVMVRIEPATVRRNLAGLGAKIDADGEGKFMQWCAHYESGKCSDEQFIAGACSLLGLNDGMEAAFADAWNSIFPSEGLILPVVNWCLKAKGQGIRIVAFSNTNALHIRHLEEEFPDMMALFDDTVYSFRAGDIKPGPGMYRYAIDDLGLDPAATLYVDDLPGNIETGCNFGFHTLLFDHKCPESLSQWQLQDWMQ